MDKQYVIRNMYLHHYLSDVVKDDEERPCSLDFDQDAKNAIKFKSVDAAQTVADALNDEFKVKLVIDEISNNSINQTVNHIEPTHYRKGVIDLYEAWYQTYPFNEFRAGMQMIAERYIKRDKHDRVEDLEKSIYTLERLKEYEMKEREND